MSLMDPTARCFGGPAKAAAWHGQDSNTTNADRDTREDGRIETVFMICKCSDTLDGLCRPEILVVSLVLWSLEDLFSFLVLQWFFSVLCFVGSFTRRKDCCSTRKIRDGSCPIFLQPLDGSVSLYDQNRYRKGHPSTLILIMPIPVPRT